MCAYKLARYENLFAQTVAVIRLHLRKKTQSIAYIYIFKTFPSLHFIFLIFNISYGATVGRAQLIAT